MKIISLFIFLFLACGCAGMKLRSPQSRQFVAPKPEKILITRQVDVVTTAQAGWHPAVSTQYCDVYASQRGPITHEEEYNTLDTRQSYEPHTQIQYVEVVASSTLNKRRLRILCAFPGNPSIGFPYKQVQGQLSSFMNIYGPDYVDENGEPLPR